MLYSPCVPDWEREVAHNHWLAVLEDQYRARKFLRSGRHVLEVGANIGWFTVLACGTNGSLVPQASRGSLLSLPATGDSGRTEKMQQAKLGP